LCVFPSVTMTSTPAARARSGVLSVQLSAITMMRSAGTVWARSAARVCWMDPSSLCAGISATMCPVPRSAGPAFLAILISLAFRVVVVIRS
jgi:hypothetical protein